jgi:hypothetical protein
VKEVEEMKEVEQEEKVCCCQCYQAASSLS